MNNSLRVLTCLAVLAASPAVGQDDSSLESAMAAAKKAEAEWEDQAEADFDKQFNMTYGQAIASYLQSTLPTVMELAAWNAPVLTAYNSKSKRVIILVFGSRTSIDSAKASLEDFRKKVLSDVLKSARAVFNFNLTEAEVEIVYMNRRSGSGAKPIVIFKDRHYVIE